MRKHLFSLVVGVLLTLAGARGAQIPERPRYPFKMNTLSDEAFGKMFFAEINLNYPGMESVKVFVEKGDYTAALAEWSKVFIARVQKQPLVSWPAVNWYPLDLLMKPDRVIMRHNNIVKDFGPPGGMDWYGVKDFSLHVNCMWHTKSLIFKVEENLRKPHQGENAETFETIQPQHEGAKHSFAALHYDDAELYARWTAVWRDFVNNNWRIGMPIAFEPELRRQKLAEAKLPTEPAEWGIKLAFTQQLLVSWMVSNWYSDTVHGVQASPEEFARYVPPRALAEMVYFIVVWPLENLTDGRKLSAEELAGGCPNQSQEKSLQLLRVEAITPEFLRSEGLEGLVSALIKNILGVDGHFSSTTDLQADGSGTELSYNYMKTLINVASGWLQIAETMEPRPDWMEPARHALEMRRRFYANLATPTGMQPLGKGHQSAPPPVPLLGRDGKAPAYTSLAFPYHGLYMMRSGWGPKDLYLSLVNCRVGQGHAAEDANSVILEAFGRYMLVHNAGEGAGFSPYFGSSWAKNTVHVDGLAQLRINGAPVHGAFSEPEDGRWHTSPHFDLAEATYRYGYGPAPVSRNDKPSVQVADVTHTRQAVFVKDAGLWFLIDRMNAPAGSEHEYTQLWHFNNDFPKEAVTPDSLAGTIATSDPKGANLFLYQAAPTGLTYHKFYSEGWSGGSEKHTDHMPANVRGWHNTGGGSEAAGEVHPAVDVHASWRGAGQQVIVTALVPSQDKSCPVVKSERIILGDRVGLTLHLSNGLKVTCLAAENVDSRAFPGVPAKANLLVLQEGGERLPRGLALDCTELNNGKPASKDFEFEMREGRFEVVAAISVPSGFNWKETPQGLQPSYEKAYSGENGKSKNPFDISRETPPGSPSAQALRP